MTPDDPRYPTGPFESVGRRLTPEERGRHIDTIAEHPARMRAAVAGLSDAQLDTPYRDGGWTVRQVVHHVVDSHLNAYVRFKLAVTEERPTIGTYEEQLWAELPDVKSAPVAGSLALLEHLHARWVAFLRALDADAFRRAFVHPEMGDLNVDILLEIYAWHGPHHEAHITRLREGEGW
ncbi:MAG: putative metal-dependent hydrolase [Gemmatimonadetes bacterium]|nr:putative metal-dependent hydrolase [Gemmatimonadota bacterium]